MEAPSRGAGAGLGASARASSQPAQPTEHAGHWCWQGSAGSARFLFCGKPTTGAESNVVGDLERSGLEIATLHQIHSSLVVDARAGDCGEGDALVSSRCGLALRVVTADCVPVLLAGETTIAAVHAGWRGLRDGIVATAVERFGRDRPRSALIGPAIGGCCYEVGADVAAEVAAGIGSTAVILQRGEGLRPHLDLRLAALFALREAGVEEVATVDACTRCDALRLSSYRREGKGAGRNLAFVWRER